MAFLLSATMAASFCVPALAAEVGGGLTGIRISAAASAA